MSEADFTLEFPDVQTIIDFSEEHDDVVVVLELVFYYPKNQTQYVAEKYEAGAPPLRQRLDDIVPLADVFAANLGPRYGKRARSVSNALGDELRAYQWPGNVRELQGLVEAAVIRVAPDAEVITELPWH